MRRRLTNKVKQKIGTDKYYQKCARSDEGDCQGRITMEHALYYAGHRLDELWAIIPICAYHHGVDQFQDCGKIDKRKHEWIALNRATDEELKKYERANFKNKRDLLNKTYGKPNNR